MLLYGNKTGPPAKSDMAKRVHARFRQRRRIFLKEWRVYRGLTQEQLAERAEMSPANISHLENGRINYTQEALEHLASALNCEPAHILMVDPTRDDAIWSIWERAEEAERTRIVDVARALVRKAAR